MREPWTLALTGAALSLLGLGLASGLVVAWTRRLEPQGPRSLVAPVLAVSALVPPLRALYTRSLALPPGEPVGREIRRLLLIGQAGWVADRIDLDPVVEALERLLAEAEAEAHGSGASAGGVDATGGIAARARALRARWEGVLDEDPGPAPDRDQK